MATRYLRITDRKEKAIETAFVRWVGTLKNWYAWKFTPDGTRGLPDRIILGPNRTIFFIEFKRPGGKLTPMQKFIHEIIKGLGFDVYVCDDDKKAREILRSYIRT